MISARRGLSVVTVAAVLAVSTPLFGQGRATLPPQSRVSGGRFAGSPPTAVAGRSGPPGQPSTTPQPDENANAHGGSAAQLRASPAADQLFQTPRLAARIAGMLGVDTLTTEPDGFRDLGLFVAAVQVADTVEGTTFEGLKLRLLGDETTEPVELRDAIQDEAALSEAEASVAAEQATREADEFIGLNSAGGTPAQEGITSRTDVRCLKSDDSDSSPSSCRDPVDLKNDGEAGQVQQ